MRVVYNIRSNIAFPFGPAIVEGGGVRLGDERRAPADRTASGAPRSPSAELSIAGESA